MIASTLFICTTGSALAAEQIETSLSKARHTVAFFDNHSWLRAPRRPNCLAVPWTRSCQIARRVYIRHRERVVRLERLLARMLPATDDWRTAVRLAQRVFPGTESWLLGISDREGGWGPFVMNHEGSGAGGWMQFMAGTFYAYNEAARRAVAARGFRVDPAVFEWHDPLGQALTAGYMRSTGRDGCHWCL
jgi:hypothetical protein